MKILENIWRWGVKPMAVGAGIVGAFGAVITLVVFGVMGLAHVYEDQFALAHEDAQVYAIFTPLALLLMWGIGVFVLNEREASKRYAREQARWAEEQAKWDARHRGDKRYAG